MTAPSDEVRAEQLARYLSSQPGVVLDLDAYSAMAMAGLIQLALKHPGVGGDMATTGRELVAQIAEGLGGPVMEMIEEGWG